MSPKDQNLPPPEDERQDESGASVAPAVDEGAINAAPVLDEASFVALHRVQLESSGVPEHLWTGLYTKMVTSVSNVRLSYVEKLLLFHLRPY